MFFLERLDNKWLCFVINIYLIILVFGNLRQNLNGLTTYVK